MKGNLTYWAKEGRDTLKSLRLTLCCDDDTEYVHSSGLAELRRRRIKRLLEEAQRQGIRLSYRDLSLILLTSKATLKRDMQEIRKEEQTDAQDELRGKALAPSA